MAFSYIAQLRDAVVTNRIAQYVNETYITARGDLPDDAVFVMSIEDAADPQQDELVRVARVGDLVSLYKDRPTAVRVGDAMYRTSSVVARYDLITDAQTAAAFVIEQVNLLVTEYQTYLTAYVANPAVLTALPQASIGVLQPAIDAYVAKVAQRQAQSATVVALRATCAQTSANKAAAQATAATLTTAAVAMRRSFAGMSALLSGSQTFLSAYNNYSGLVKGTLDTWAAQRASVGAVPQVALDAYLKDGTGSLAISHYSVTAASANSYELKLQQAASALVQLTVDLQSMEAALRVAQTEVTTLSAESVTCAANVAAAEATETQLLAEEAALLAEVQRLCPSYTP